MTNYEIKKFLKENNIRMWEIARALNVNEATFSKWFREELSEEKQKKIAIAVAKIRISRKDDEDEHWSWCEKLIGKIETDEEGRF